MSDAPYLIFGAVAGAVVGAGVAAGVLAWVTRKGARR